MPKIHHCLLVVLTFIGGCDQSSAPMVVVPDSAVDPEIAVLAQLMAGVYRGPDATVADPGPDDLMTDTRLIVEVPALGPNVMYWQVRSGSDQRIYRRVLMVLERDQSGRIVQFSRGLRDGLQWPAEPGVFSFAGLGPEDFVPVLPDGCVSVWTRIQDGFSAYLDPEYCRVFSERQQMWRKIEAETIVLPAGLRQTERGYSDSGEMLFGTPPGKYHELPRL